MISPAYITIMMITMKTKMLMMKLADFNYLEINNDYDD